MGVISAERLRSETQTSSVTLLLKAGLVHPEGEEDWTYFSCLCFRQLQNGQVTLQVHAGEETAPLLLETSQVLQNTDKQIPEVTIFTA